MGNAAELSEIELRKAKRKEYDKKYYAENKEKKKEQVKQYQKENKYKEYKKCYKKENADKIKEYMKCYGKQYRQENPDKIKEKNKRYYEKMATKTALTVRQFKAALIGWSIAVKERDGNCCRICSSTHNLHAHHILYKALFPCLALNINNGITLCQTCHVEIHQKEAFI